MKKIGFMLFTTMVFLTSLYATKLRRAYAGGFAFDASAAYSDTVSTDTRLVYKGGRDGCIKVGAEQFTWEGPEDIASAGLKVPLFGSEKANSMLVGDSGDAWDSKTIISPDDNTNVLIGGGRNEDNEIFYGGFNHMRNAPDNPNNFGFGGEVIDTNGERDWGGYVFLRFDTVFGYGTYHDRDKIIICTPNEEGGPAARFLRIKRADGSERHELVVTPQAMGIDMYGTLQTVKSNGLAYDESPVMPGTNPFRCDLSTEQRGKDWVFGFEHNKSRDSKKSMGFESISYISPDGWIGFGYKNTLEDTDEFRLMAGRTTGSYFTMKESDPFSVRVDLTYDQDTHKVGGAVKAMKAF